MSRLEADIQTASSSMGTTMARVRTTTHRHPPAGRSNTIHECVCVCHEAPFLLSQANLAEGGCAGCEGRATQSKLRLLYLMSQEEWFRERLSLRDEHRPTTQGGVPLRRCKVPSQELPRHRDDPLVLVRLVLHGLAPKL